MNSIIIIIVLFLFLFYFFTLGIKDPEGLEKIRRKLS